jgi:hypothetical protein
MLGREQRGVGAWLGRRVGRDANGDAAAAELLAVGGELCVRDGQILVAGEKPGKNQLARWVPSERLGDREQLGQPRRLARKDDDRAAARSRRRLAPVRRLERRILAEDCLLELLKRRARLEPELVDEQRSSVAVDSESVGLPARPVQRAHQLGAERLA